MTASLLQRPIVWMILHAMLIGLLIVRMPLDAWFVGDPGVKLIAARSAIAHPARPFETELPPVPIAIAGEYPQPFFVPHGDHAHAFTPATFPILTAPFLAALGLLGLYVLPALGWLIAVPLTAHLSRILGARGSPALLMLCGLVATPLIFYGLEFWEHTPAVALILAAACVTLNPRTSAVAISAAGIAGGVAALLRPEAIWWTVALAMVMLRDGGRSRRLGAFGLGVVIAGLPIAAYNLGHFGTLTGPHIGGNLARLAAGWAGERIVFLSTWLVPGRSSSLVLAGVLLASHAIARRAAWRPIAVTAGMVAAVLLMTEMARGHDIRENLWRVCPMALLVFLPAVERTPTRRTLELLILLPIAGVWLTAPNDGGGQWGPRYLLPAVPLLLILALDSLAALGPRYERAVILVAALGVLAGAVVSRSAWRELVGSKQEYAQLVHETAAEAAAASHVVTDVWWFGQVHAAVFGPAQVLHVEAGRAAPLIAQLGGGDDVLLVQAAGAANAPASDWIKGTCYTARSTRVDTSGRLAYIQLSCK